MGDLYRLEYRIFEWNASHMSRDHKDFIYLSSNVKKKIKAIILFNRYFHYSTHTLITHSSQSHYAL